MNRKHWLVLVVMIAFVFAMSACSKKQTVDMSDANMEPVAEPVVEPPVVKEPPVAKPEMKPEKMPVLEDVFFEFDKADLSSAAKRTLESNARQLKDAMNAKVMIEGHCDERGTTAYNLALGDRRAKAAQNYLKSLGVSAGQMETVSYGEERPFAMGHDEAAWSKNRRAHFVVSKK